MQDMLLKPVPLHQHHSKSSWIPALENEINQRETS